MTETSNPAGSPSAAEAQVLPNQQVQSLRASLQQGGTDALLQELAKELREQARYHESLEVLKMMERRQLGIPAVSHDGDAKLDRELRDQLDDRLLDVCREVGVLFLKQGKLQEGWMYLRPVGDLELVNRHLEAIPIEDDNLDAWIGILLSEGVDPERGFRLVLERYGTCNAITTFDTEMPRRSSKFKPQPPACWWFTCIGS